MNFYQFNNNQNNMIENGVINILANPSDINAYTMAPCCIWNMPYSSAATFRYDSDTDKRILTNALAGNNYFFWLGHGNWNTILGNADHSNISAREVQDALGNLLPQATPKHPKTNSHPYKLVVINGCQTDGDLWPRSFGIDYDPPGTTNYVPWYQATGRSPRAFIGWTKENYAPGAGDVTGLAHAEFGDALGALWSDWMRGFPLNLCIRILQTAQYKMALPGRIRTIFLDALTYSEENDILAHGYTYFRIPLSSYYFDASPGKLVLRKTRIASESRLRENGTSGKEVIPSHQVQTTLVAAF